MAAGKDYSGTPLSQKLGAKPSVGVVVYFTTTCDELERRFDSLKGNARPGGRARGWYARLFHLGDARA
jgi:hypothetical protein